LADPLTDLYRRTGHLETQHAVLEIKYEYIKGFFEDTKQELKNLSGKVEDISTHITKQNGALPRIETQLERLVSTMDTQDDRITKQEENSAKISLRQKIIWGAAATIGTGLLGLVIKLIVGALK